MLFYLFSEDELGRLLRQLGYESGPDTARKNIEYYDARTSHGSTLSFITHAAVLASVDPASSWERFMVALESDVGDVQGGTTKEGIHLGVMAGTLDLIQRSYVGCAIRDGMLVFNPRLTDRLDGLSFPMQFRGTPLTVTLASDGVDRRGRARGLPAADPRRRRRRRPRATRRRSTHVCAHGRRRGMRPMAAGFAGAIFDVDGVLVDSPHEQAWSDSLAELMENEWADIRDQTTYSPDAFDKVYQQVMSGKPRFAGAQAALEYFGVPDAETRAKTYGDHKQEMVVKLIEAGSVQRLPGRAAVHHRRQGLGDQGRGRVLVEEREPVPAPDPARHVRGRQRHHV